ncbi:MAG: bifunctional glutamate N-acetyltransferase/amino-acid acetyltransferase ArgJ [Alphaproteobacteria bacterium]|nr:bifunctional glutamate N-acetyltransferase/amino-acid acetyltransferase ArgJ [Alphaproteobacteria bacterium]
MTAPSPLAPKTFPDMPPVAGVRLAVAETGIRYKNRPDLLLTDCAEGTTSAGVFTLSLTAAAPIHWCQNILKHGTARALIVNAGNANAFTGTEGDAGTRAMAEAAAKAVGGAAESVFVASTGVIGNPLKTDRIAAAIPTMTASASWLDAARAIGTTDTFPKGATRTATIHGTKVTLCGIAKGSGMIAPNMATMLGFVFTDAAIPAPLLQELLTEGNRISFNAITVDGDTSTNDTLLLFATGKAGNKAATRADLVDFRRALTELLQDLAWQIVRDGEGASKFIAIKVTGAASDDAAHRIGMTIANSPLVKTAIAGEDPNWGRIVAAAGRSGEKLDVNNLVVHIGPHRITEHGGLIPGYDETPVAAYMKGQELEISVDVGIGTGAATVWTCDFTEGYIRINGSYRS